MRNFWILRVWQGIVWMKKPYFRLTLFYFSIPFFCLYLHVFKASIRCYNVSVRVHFSSCWYILLLSWTRCNFIKALKNKRLKILTWWWCWGSLSIDSRRLNSNKITWLDIWYKELHHFTCSTFIWGRVWGGCYKFRLCFFLVGSQLFLVPYSLILFPLNQAFHYQPMCCIFLINFDGINVLCRFFVMEGWYRTFRSLVWHFQWSMHFSRHPHQTIQLQTQNLLIYFWTFWTVELIYHPNDLLETWRQPRQGAEVNLWCVAASWW